MSRVITYIDGFNFYFGLKAKGWRKYYWVDLAAMSRRLLKPDQELVACHYFTARIKKRNHGQSADRQKIWLEALKERDDITLHFGHYLIKRRQCHNCGAQWESAEEKMTDVNIATQLLIDAMHDRFDTAIIVSGDSDLTTPVLEVLRNFPKKRIIIAFPPKRHSAQLQKVASGYLTIGEDKLRKSLLPDEITKADGYILRRPDEWR